MALCSGNAALREWPIDGSALAVDNRLKRRAHRIALPPPDPLESIFHSRVGIPSWTIANLRDGKQAVVDLAGSDQVRTPHGFGQGDVQVCSNAPPCWRACAGPYKTLVERMPGRSPLRLLDRHNRHR